jgi:hypothetical protein
MGQEGHGPVHVPQVPAAPEPTVAEPGETARDGEHAQVDDARGQERHFPGKDFDLTQTVNASGEMEWSVLLYRHPAEKPEPVRDESGQAP